MRPSSQPDRLRRVNIVTAHRHGTSSRRPDQAGVEMHTPHQRSRCVNAQKETEHSQGMGADDGSHLALRHPRRSRCARVWLMVRLYQSERVPARASGDSRPLEPDCGCSLDAPAAPNRRLKSSKISGTDPKAQRMRAPVIHCSSTTTTCPSSYPRD